MRLKNKARIQFLEGMEWGSEMHGTLVKCLDFTLQDVDTGRVLSNIDTDDDVEDVWEDYKASITLT